MFGFKLSFKRTSMLTQLHHFQNCKVGWSELKVRVICISSNFVNPWSQALYTQQTN